MKDSKSYLWNTCFYQKMNSNYIQSLSQWKACKLWVASAIFGGFFYIQTEHKKSEDIFFQFTPPPWLYRALRPWQTRTHCCRHKCFPVCLRAQHLLRTQKWFWFCSETFCVRNKCFSVCAAQETSWARMCLQQCVLVYQGLYKHTRSLSRGIWRFHRLWPILLAVW